VFQASLLALGGVEKGLGAFGRGKVLGPQKYCAGSAALLAVLACFKQQQPILTLKPCNTVVCQP
jgi:hypothetical protein